MMDKSPEPGLKQNVAAPAGRLFGIRTKIVVPFVLLFLLCLLLVGAIAVNQVTRSVEKRLNPERLGSLIIRAGFPLNNTSLEHIKEIIGCEVITLSADYEILHSTLSEFDEGRASAHFKLAGEKNSLRPSTMINDPGFYGFYYVYHPVSDRAPEISNVAGLILAVPEEIVDREKSSTIRPILVAALIGTLLIIIIGLYIAHTITRPVRRFAKFADDIRSGALDRRIVVKSRDEIRDLANAFNAMLERLRDSESQLVEREKMAAIGSIATGMAHEIRNPLSSIRMTVQLLLRKTEDEKVKFELELILREIERLSYTLSELLIFARPPRPARAETDLGNLIGETLAVLRPQLDHHEIEIEQDYEEKLPHAYVDPNHFRQVMMNLVINAIEAMPGGGKILVSLAARDANIILKVRNSGSPIPPELGDRIFEPFFTSKAGGSGLGLAVTKIIVDSHGGDISYTSDAEKTEFTIRIPPGSVGGYVPPGKTEKEASPGQT